MICRGFRLAFDRYQKTLVFGQPCPPAELRLFRSQLSKQDCRVGFRYLAILFRCYPNPGLRPRRAGRVLAIMPPSLLPSVIFLSTSAPGTNLVFAAQWLAYALPCRRFADTLTDARARLGADVVRYSFIVVDLHHLLFAGFDRRTRNQEFRDELTSQLYRYIKEL